MRLSVKKQTHFLSICILSVLTITCAAQSFDASIRTIHVADSDNIAFAGSGGFIGYTSNGGETWDTTRWAVKTPQDSIIHPSFRSCYIVGNKMLAVGIASPGFIMRAPLNDLNSSTVVHADYDER
ncbi:MAG: hypothetical protein OSA04_04325, partial [Flavobacteriales bacterium]|nr:hypothetical protein [Flavobacteriales bacterium]